MDKAFCQAAEELCSDRNLIFQLWGGRIFRFSFSAVFVSFLVADKIPEKKENLRKKGNFFFWLTVRWCVCCGRGEVWPGKNVGDSCCIRGSRRVRHPVTLLPVKKWDSMLGLHSLPPSFSFTVYGCIVYAHHTAVQGIEKSTLKRDLLPRWNFSTDTITVMPLSWSRWLHILQVDNQDSHWHVCSCRGPELSSEHLCRMTPTVCESTPIGSGAFFWSKCVFNHMCTYPIPFQAYTHNQN